MAPPQGTNTTGIPHKYLTRSRGTTGTSYTTSPAGVRITHHLRESDAPFMTPLLLPYPIIPLPEGADPMAEMMHSLL